MESPSLEQRLPAVSNRSAGEVRPSNSSVVWSLELSARIPSPPAPSRLVPSVCVCGCAEQVEADIAPFRALLLGMFFMTVGFEIDLALCFNNLPIITGLVSSRFVSRRRAVVTDLSSCDAALHVGQTMSCA